MGISVESGLPQIGAPSGAALTQALLEALPFGALLIDPAGQIVAANSQAERVLGWSAGTLENRSAHELLDCGGEAREQAPEQCPIAAVLGGLSAVSEGRSSIRCANGELKPVEYGCAPYPTEAGRGAMLVFHDLGPRLEQEKNLRRLASIAEDSPIAIVELNEDGNMLHANPAMMNLLQRFGFTAAARPAILPAHIQQLASQCRQSQSAMDGIEVLFKGTHYEWKLVPVSGERLVRAYGIDITARKRVEIELLEAKAKAEAAARAKAEFLANTKQEIRAPARVIFGAAQVLEGGALSEEQRDYVKAIQASAEELIRAIDNILEAASFTEGATRFDGAGVDFRLFMHLVTAPLAHQAEQKGLRFSVTVSSRVPVQVVCDRARLGQILTHLVCNAIKFTDRGQIGVEVDRDTLAADDSGEKSLYLFFSVRDSGVGIPKDKQGAIFDSFTRAGGAASRRYGGNGLGLAIAKQMLGLMGGTIGVESEAGKGSRFWFSMPTRESEDAVEGESDPSLPDSLTVL